MFANLRLAVSAVLLNWAAAACLVLSAGVCAAAETYTPPKTWNGTREGSTDGNPALVNGAPMWRLDRAYHTLELSDLEDPDNYKPFTWTNSLWFNPKDSLDGRPWAQVKEGAITFGLRGRYSTKTYWINRDSEYSFRFGALTFIAPKDGNYTLSTSVEIQYVEGSPAMSLFLFKKETSRKGVEFIKHIMDYDPKCNWWGKVPLEPNKNNEINSRKIELRKGDELIVVPSIEGDNPLGNAIFKNLSITGEEIPGGIAEKVRQPRPRTHVAIAKADQPSDIIFPACTEAIDTTKEFWGGYRGLHAGHSCAQVIDITRPPYNADNTGKTDVSDILTRALIENRNCNRIVYLPNGVYMVTKTVKQREDGGNIGPCLQGQSRKGTIIRLKDGTWPTADGKLHGVLKTGGGKPENFQRIVRNLTISIGRNNDGASGLFFYGNNQSSMSDIDIISEDGKGQVGLDLEAGGPDQGPCLVRNTYIKGFKVGAKGTPLSSVTIHNLSLEGQSQVGILHRHHGLFVYGLTSTNRVPAVSCGNGFLLVNGKLMGGDAGVPAIKHSGGLLFVRNVSVAGYGKPIETPKVEGVPLPTGPTIEEFSAQKAASLFGPPQRSLNLPVKEPPEPPWEQDMSKWASVEDYRVEGVTDAEALQAAIDDKDNTTICVPARLRINRLETVFVRGNISRIIGTGGSLIGDGKLVVVDDGPPVVKIERMWLVNFFNRSQRTVVLESVIGHICHEGSGDMFMSDGCVLAEVRNPEARLWMWQFNAEGHNDDDLVVSGGTVWVFGWKTEAWGTKVVATGGTIEILGFQGYFGPLDKAMWPLFSIRDTTFSIAGGTQTTFGGGLYHRLVKETRGGVTKELTKDQSPGGYNLPLYTSWSKDATPPVGRPSGM